MGQGVDPTSLASSLIHHGGRDRTLRSSMHLLESGAAPLRPRSRRRAPHAQGRRPGPGRTGPPRVVRIPRVDRFQSLPPSLRQRAHAHRRAPLRTLPWSALRPAGRQRRRARALGPAPRRRYRLVHLRVHPDPADRIEAALAQLAVAATLDDLRRGCRMRTSDPVRPSRRPGPRRPRRQVRRRLPPRAAPSRAHRRARRRRAAHRVFDLRAGTPCPRNASRGALPLAAAPPSARRAKLAPPFPGSSSL
jgi:hypothetical protein